MQIREGLDYHQAVKEILQTIDWLKSTGAQKVLPYELYKHTLTSKDNDTVICQFG